MAGGFAVVSANKSKTRSRRLVPISAILGQWLASHAQQEGKVWQFSDILFHKRSAATAKAAGVTWKANALRHRFASYRLAQVQSASQVALETDQQLLLEQLGWRLPAQTSPRITAKREVQM